jgi:TetR/AcrR family transcriptional repressor of nem operon
MNKAEKTKQFIIEKTAPVFNIKGFAGTSLSDITEVTALTKGCIYGHFSNKDEIAFAVFDYNLKKVNEIINAKISHHLSVKEKLLAYINVYDNYLKLPFPNGGCPVLNTSVEADDTHPELRKKANAAILSWKNKIIKMLEKGIADKELKAGTDAEQIALSIIALIEGGIMISKVTGKISYLTTVLQSAKKIINDLK